jgi:hypothetical protein
MWFLLFFAELEKLPALAIGKILKQKAAIHDHPAYPRYLHRRM